MHRWTRTLLCFAAAIGCQAAAAQGSSQAATLRQAFEAAWARQPEALATNSRRDAAEARRQVAEGWTAAPPAVELSTRTTQLNRDTGQREFEAALALPLWLPGESRRSAALADAESRAVDSRTGAAQLRIAAAVREAWWALRRAQVDLEVAERRLDNARALAADVVRRVSAGDLARSDRYQAEGAVAVAEAGLAEHQTAFAIAVQQMRTLAGGAVPARTATEAEPEPGASEAGSSHALLREWDDKLEFARRSAALAEVQTRANPELMLGTMRERGSFGDSYSTSLALGVRIPFGSGDRQRARNADARAEMLEAQAQAALVRTRIAAEVDLARSRLEATRAQAAAAQRRATLAADTRGFFERSFRLGETDLPTRLRIELEAFEAERQAARVRIDVAAAISLLRQALGLLPE